MAEVLTGGCQCGAVRFRAEDLGESGVCHCRMCQKAFGSFFAPLVTARKVSWTRGEPSFFQSSNRARRGFCAKCGTPLYFQLDDRTEFELAVGAFDDPMAVAPDHQLNPNDKLAIYDLLPTLKAAKQAPHDAHNATIVSYQHPDHDTDRWPERV